MAPVLIAGAGGFLGRHLSARLAAQGARVLTLGTPGRPAAAPLPAGAVRIEAAAWTAEAIAEALPAGVALGTVYLLAAAGVDPSQRRPRDLLQVNIALPQLLLEALALHALAPRVILTGTCSEYFPVVDGRLSEETDAAAGADTYGASKAAGAVWALKLARQLGIPLVHLRLFHFYGPSEAPHRLISSLFRQLGAGQPVRLSPGEQYRDMLYVEDVLDALEAAAARAPAWETLNVASARPVRIADVARATARALGQPESLLEFGALDYRPGEVMWIAGDSARFRQATGWQPRFSLEEGIADMLRRSRESSHV